MDQYVTSVRRNRYLLYRKPTVQRESDVGGRGGTADGLPAVWEIRKANVIR